MTLSSLFGHSNSIRPEELFGALDRSQAIICFTPEGKIQWANDNFCKALNYRLEEITGRHHAMFVDPQYAESDDYRRFWDDLRRGEYQSATFKRISKSGRPIWIQATYNPIFDQNGKPYMVTKYASDITQTKKVALETNDVASSVSAATEEMSSSIADIARSMSTVRDSVDLATDVVKNAENSLNDLVKAIGSMSEIAQLIADISGQINLLALNAAIEAARAGDAGRGFAVVADEVKKLASRTTESTGRIEHEIKSVQGLSAQVNETLKRIVDTVSSINEGTTTVAAATEEQSSVVNEITKQVTYLADLITKRKAA